MGIEPTALAWEARVLPLYDARAGRYFTGVSALWGIGIVVGGVKSGCTWKVIAGIAACCWLHARGRVLSGNPKPLIPMDRDDTR
jgi:hypothetical protein